MPAVAYIAARNGMRSGTGLGSGVGGGGGGDGGDGRRRPCWLMVLCGDGKRLYFFLLLFFVWTIVYAETKVTYRKRAINLQLVVLISLTRPSAGMSILC